MPTTYITYFLCDMYIHTVNIQLFMLKSVFTGPPALVTVNVTKNNESLSNVVQWDAVDPLLATNYTVTWTSETDRTPLRANTMETSYTITGLILDTVYTITISAVNMCGRGPVFTTSVSFPTGMYGYVCTTSSSAMCTKF